VQVWSGPIGDEAELPHQERKIREGVTSETARTELSLFSVGFTEFLVNPLKIEPPQIASPLLPYATFAVVRSDSSKGAASLGQFQKNVNENLAGKSLPKRPTVGGLFSSMCRQICNPILGRRKGTSRKIRQIMRSPYARGNLGL